jgi:hypothetical protein
MVLFYLRYTLYCVSRMRIALRGNATFIVVKAASSLGRALSGIRFAVPFHQHEDCGEVPRYMVVVVPALRRRAEHA